MMVSVKKILLISVAVTLRKLVLLENFANLKKATAKKKKQLDDVYKSPKYAPNNISLFVLVMEKLIVTIALEPLQEFQNLIQEPARRQLTFAEEKLAQAILSVKHLPPPVN